ncbi:chitinase-3-like protein 1 [Bacillus rossius redtenbacheri]|uniref:chitinase-3-like protein 1 n=1 Tax=Bacillus rossius redtenbacheri TaxID=93214 RepID=UPI002FDE1037
MSNDKGKQKGMFTPVVQKSKLAWKSVKGNGSLETRGSAHSSAWRQTTRSAEYRVVCYYESWAVYRPGNGKYDVEDIDPTLCTHLLYTFVGLGDHNNVEVLDAWNDLPDDYGLNAFARFVKLAHKNPRAKAMVSIGGWNEGSSKYSKMASTQEGRAQFADNAVAFLQKHGFEGLDIDWEYPAQRGGDGGDKENFPKLLETVYKKFQEHGFLLSVALGAGSETVDTSYIVPEIAKNVDFMNLMTYDFHGDWDSETGEDAPLYPHSSEWDDERELNVDASVRNYLKLGAPADKINLGLGLYGRSFTLQDPEHHGIGAQVSGSGSPGQYTEEAGMLGYNEICELKDKWTVVWNKDQKVPYAFSGNQWVGYDNVQSIQLKSQYVKDKNLGGAMVWAVDTDDFKNVCGEGKNSLLQAINDILKGATPPAEQPATSAPKTTKPPRPTSATAQGSTGQRPTQTSAAPAPAGICDHAGYVRDPSNCQVFYECVSSGSGYVSYRYECPEGTYFDTSIGQCNFAAQVACPASG